MTTRNDISPTADAEPAWLKDRHFIPLPGNPDDLTYEHVRAAFAGDWSALKDVRRVAQEIDRERRAQALTTDK